MSFAMCLLNTTAHFTFLLSDERSTNCDVIEKGPCIGVLRTLAVISVTILLPTRPHGTN